MTVHLNVKLMLWRSIREAVLLEKNGDRTLVLIQRKNQAIVHVLKKAVRRIYKSTFISIERRSLRKGSRNCRTRWENRGLKLSLSVLLGIVGLQLVVNLVRAIRDVNKYGQQPDTTEWETTRSEEK